MRIETERLALEVFTLELIDAAATKDCARIAGLGYQASDEWPEENLADALPVFRELINVNGIDGFNSWLILLGSDRRIIGSVGFLDRPDVDGVVELGFGLVPSMRGHGFCTEAVKALSFWGIRQNGVSLISAHCDYNNDLSANVLRRAGFRETGRDDGLIDWEFAEKEIPGIASEE